MSASNKELFRYGAPNYVLARIAYNQEIKKGELLKKAATGLCTPVSQASDNDTLYVIADQAHAALSADDGKVHTVRSMVLDPSCVFEFPINGTPNLVEGSGLAIHDSQTLKLAATDHVALCVELKPAATVAKCVFLTPPLWGGASQNLSFTAA